MSHRMQVNERNEVPTGGEKEYGQVIPPELIDSFRAKEKDKTDQGFAFKLWNLLQWAGNDQVRRANLGIGWIDKDEFFIEKSRFAKVVEMPLNTLNYKLRSCKFQQSKQRKSAHTYWKCQNFSINSTPQDLEEVDQRRNINDNCPSIVLQALYLPELDDVRIYTGQPADLLRFKIDSILEWNEIVNVEIWALNRTDFIVKAAERYSRPCDSGGNEIFNYDAQQTEFVQYLKSHNLNPVVTARQMLNYVIKTKKPNIITIEDFCMFFARFGPWDCVLEKIHQLLCCSRTFGDWFQPGEQKFDQTKNVTGSYSNTFANCFIIKRMQGATYHVYNLPLASTKTRFLVDETAKKFLTWHAVFESFSPPQQHPLGYYPDVETL